MEQLKLSHGAPTAHFFDPDALDRGRCRCRSEPSGSTLLMFSSFQISKRGLYLSEALGSLILTLDDSMLRLAYD